LELTVLFIFTKEKILTVAGTTITHYHAIELKADVDVEIESKRRNKYIVMLQGKPIGEPVMQYGPFVMNTKQEINEAFEDYHKTQFGGWPWPRYDQVHARDKKRFAKYADGKLEEKNS
jgi:redox-sensitive bicupin YhaK (pirin superfamily)